MSTRQERIEELALSRHTHRQITEWNILALRFKKKNPTCAACGATRMLTVHHKKPVYLYPELELDEENLIVLCERGMKCHNNIGHLGSSKSINKNVVGDAARQLERVKNRPKYGEDPWLED